MSNGTKTLRLSRETVRDLEAGGLAAAAGGAAALNYTNPGGLVCDLVIGEENAVFNFYNRETAWINGAGSAQLCL
jgi:hypothetical protein